jgi:hypothetical protein
VVFRFYFSCGCIHGFCWCFAVSSSRHPLVIRVATTGIVHETKPHVRIWLSVKSLYFQVMLCIYTEFVEQYKLQPGLWNKARQASKIDASTMFNLGIAHCFLSSKFPRDFHRSQARLLNEG